jgi:uncharacterized lipoprotein NlpE involved in copper resistance
MRGFVKFSLILLVEATVVSAAARQSGEGATPAQGANVHNSRNSLDWAGTYEGVLSCADCQGTKTRLTLNSDGSYRLVTQAQGSQNAEKAVSGVFRWQPMGTPSPSTDAAADSSFPWARGGSHCFGRKAALHCPLRPIWC